CRILRHRHPHHDLYADCQAQQGHGLHRYDHYRCQGSERQCPGSCRHLVIHHDHHRFVHHGFQFLICSVHPEKRRLFSLLFFYLLPPYPHYCQESADMPLNKKTLLRLIVMMAACCLFTFMAEEEGRSEEFHNALSLQGFTGILNTPTAALTKEGHIYALFSDQKENSLRPRLKREDSYMFSVGLFDLLEMGGRFTEAPNYSYTTGGMRDLSGNFKLQVPFIPKGKYIPQLAVGVQDLGGNLHRLRTVYGAATEGIWRFRISAGAGIGPDRMKGGFGGIEAKAFDWLYLLGEYDTREVNVGVRLVTPEMFGIPVNLQVTVKSALNDKQGNPEYGFGFQMPLGYDHYNRQPLPKAGENVQDKGTEGVRANEAEPQAAAPAASSQMLTS